VSKNVLDIGQLTVFRIVRDIKDDQLTVSKNVLDIGQLTVFNIVRDIGNDQLSVSIDVCNKDNVQHTAMC
jgi:hypothetical protein